MSLLDEWHWVTEDLPYDEVIVVVIDRHGDYGISYRDGDNWYMAYTHKPVDAIVAWSYIFPPVQKVEKEAA